MEPACTLALSANFGSAERWREAFTAGAQASAGEAGQMQLVFQPSLGMLVNQWVPDGAHTASDAETILALDLHGPTHVADVAARVNDFMDQVDWAAAYARYQNVVNAASEPHGATFDAAADALVFDVRRAGVFEKAPTVIAGARWRDPATVGLWAADLPKDRAVVVYCVYGHEISRATALRLRAAGLNARFLQGGIDHWQTEGRPTQPKGAES